MIVGVALILFALIVAGYIGPVLLSRPGRPAAPFIPAPRRHVGTPRRRPYDWENE